MMDLKNKKAIIFSHTEGGSGNWQDEFLNFLLSNNIDEAIAIDFPFGLKAEKIINVKLFKGGKNKLNKFSAAKFFKTEPLSYIRDFVYSLYYGLLYARNSDVFIATDNLLTIAGVIFKKIGLVKKVFYVMIDYTPVRYKNRLLDGVYYLIDKIAGYGCDQIWPLSNAMIEGRFRDGKLQRTKVKYKEAPFGNRSLSRKEEDYQCGSQNKIVYFGGIMKSKGAELFVPIVEALIGKGFFDFKFICIGGGEVEWLKNEVSKSGLTEYFEIHGRIEDYNEIEKIMLGCGVALAPYYPEDKNNFSYYADPGKIKAYLGCGLPVIVTNVPPIAVEIQKNRAGKIALYDSDDFADKILEVIHHHEEYKKGTISFGKKFDWNIIFENLLKGNI